MIKYVISMLMIYKFLQQGLDGFEILCNVIWELIIHGYLSLFVPLLGDSTYFSNSGILVLLFQNEDIVCPYSNTTDGILNILLLYIRDNDSLKCDRILEMVL